MARFSTISAAVALFVAGTSAVAIPTPEGELIPGPGLPSLASLGLTRKDLLAMGPLEIPASYHEYRARRALQSGKRQTETTLPDCENNYTLPRADALACVNFLASLGTQECTVSGGFTQQMCYEGGAQIIGANVNELPSVSSYCSDVAIAAQWVYNNCGVDSTTMNAGADYANGNGNLLISIVPS